MSSKDVVILGAGPAGLAAGYELAKKGHNVTCLEKENSVGGISKTILHNDFRFDIGGHRFFTKITEVEKLWKEVLGDKFLRRPRLSRIYYRNEFFRYPLKPMNALFGLGFFTSCSILQSYFSSRLKPYPQENTFEEWVSNRFGKRLYEIFFKTYTEKVWGIGCEQIQAEWAAQRIKGLSLSSAIKSALFGDKNQNIKTLIEEFDYPQYGPGQMYEAMAERIESMGGKVLRNHEVQKIKINYDRIESVGVSDSKGNIKKIEGTDFISSIPIDELVISAENQTPQSVIQAARDLRYRSLLTVNLMFEGEERFSDTWVYIHSPEVKAGRIQFFKNWSPYMVPNGRLSSRGMEYFCTEGDELWSKPDGALIELAKKEIQRLGLLGNLNIVDAFVVRTAKTYPVYMSGYKKHIEIIKRYVNQLGNLICIGRNGLFKYNNMDHSILSGLLAARNICGENHDLWAINSDDEYQETAKNHNS